MSLSKFSNFLWLCLAFTFPLFAVEFFRFGDVKGAMSIPIPMLLVIVAVFCQIVNSLISERSLPNPFYEVGYLLSSLLILFLFLSIISIVFLGGNQESTKELLKLVIGYFCMVGVIVFFPKNMEFFEYFWVIAMWASAVLVGALIYRYGFVFKEPYLSITWDQPNPDGKNQLSWYLVFITPFTIFGLMSTSVSRKLLTSIPAVICIVGAFYTGSRSGVLPIFIGCCLVFFKGFRGGIKGFRNILLLILATGIIGYIAWWAIPQFVDDPIFIERFAISGSDTVSGIKEEARFTLLNVGWDAFLSAPISGVGFGNAYHLHKYSAKFSLHNDYLRILCELGVFGLALFMGILFIVMMRVWNLNLPAHSGQIPWVVMGAQASLLAVIIRLFFDNAFLTPIMWIFFGLVIIPSTMRRSTFEFREPQISSERF